MAKNEGNAHGRHYTEDEKEQDALRNNNRSKGRQHFEADSDQKAGGHSDKHASSVTGDGGQQHEFRHDGNDDDENRHSRPQNEGGMQGDARNQGGHQGGRNQPN
jgi:hypothetical protein